MFIGIGTNWMYLSASNKLRVFEMKTNSNQKCFAYMSKKLDLSFFILYSFIQRMFGIHYDKNELEL